MDGKNIFAVSTKAKAIVRYQEKYDVSRKRATKEFTNEWQEVYVD
jgi:hypothetical protein